MSRTPGVGAEVLVSRGNWGGKGVSFHGTPDWACSEALLSGWPSLGSPLETAGKDHDDVSGTRQRLDFRKP